MPGGAAAYHHCRTVTASSGCGAAIFVQHGHTVASLRCVDTACTTDDITQTFDKCEELVPRQMRWWSNAIGTTIHDGDHQTKVIPRVELRRREQQRQVGSEPHAPGAGGGGSVGV